MVIEYVKKIRYVGTCIENKMFFTQQNFYQILYQGDRLFVPDSCYSYEQNNKLYLNILFLGIQCANPPNSDIYVQK